MDAIPKSLTARVISKVPKIGAKIASFPTWIIITIVVLVVAAAATGITFGVLFLKRRSKRRVDEAYTKALVDQALIAQNLETQTKIVENAEKTAIEKLDTAGKQQDIAFDTVANATKELKQLQQSLAAAVVATNSLKNEQNALDNQKKAETALAKTSADTAFIENAEEKAKQATTKTITDVTKTLQDQADALSEYRKKLQATAQKLAQDVSNPSITEPVETSKPSVRTIWDAAVNLVATTDPPDLAIKQLAEIYSIPEGDGVELKKLAYEYNNPKTCDRSLRIIIDGKTQCAPGYTDTGRTDEYQCQRGPCGSIPEPAPAPTPAPTPAPAPKPEPAPRPPTALERKYPYWGWDKNAGLRCTNNNNTGCNTGYDAKGQLVDLNPDRPPAPKPQPPPRPPTALERKYPHWGWDKNAGLRCARPDNTGCNTGYDAKGQLVDLNPDRPPAPAPSQNNPHGIPDQVMRTLGMDVDQVSAALNLINGPEQSQSRWWERLNKQNVYGYCENIRDKRGVTMGLTGFVTAYNGPQEIIKNAGGPSFANGRYGTDSYPDERAMCDWVKANQNNKRFQEAQWDYYLKMYIKPMMAAVNKYVPDNVKREPLILAALLDSTINQGLGGCSKCTDTFMKNARGNDRANWLNSFLNIRNANFTEGNTAKMREGRLNVFRRLAVDGKWDLRGIDHCKYNYCSGRCVHC